MCSCLGSSITEAAALLSLIERDDRDHPALRLDLVLPLPGCYLYCPGASIGGPGHHGEMNDDSKLLLFIINSKWY